MKVPAAAEEPPITVPSMSPPLISAVLIVPIPDTSTLSKVDPPETSKPPLASIKPENVEIPVNCAFSYERPLVAEAHSRTPLAPN